MPSEKPVDMPIDRPQDAQHPAPETEIVSGWRVACDGSEGALGHPRVWLSIPHDRGWVECGYCDKRYVHEDFADGKASG